MCRSWQAKRFADRRFEHVQRDRLHEIRGRLEHGHRLVSREDAGEDEWHAVSAQTLRDAQSVGLTRFDDSRSYPDKIGVIPHPHDGLVPQSPHYVLQQGTNVVVWLAEKHAGHDSSITSRGRECTPMMV
jgi:hypothetical protein